MVSLFRLLLVGAIVLSIIIFVMEPAIAGPSGKIPSRFDYVILALMVFTAAVPILLYNLFLTGGELFWYLSSRYGNWIQLLDLFVPKVCGFTVAMAFLAFDWKTCLIMTAGSFITAFIIMVVPSAITQGQSNIFIRGLVPIFHFVALLCVLYFALIFFQFIWHRA